MATDTPQPRQRDGVDETLIRDGGLSYLEIPATDVHRSAVFYEAVLGWKISRDDPTTPKFMDPAGLLLGRWITTRRAPAEPGLLPYFYVDHIHDVVARATDSGGQLVKPISAEGNLLVATIRDPGGNVIGLWQIAVGQA